MLKQACPGTQVPPAPPAKSARAPLRPPRPRYALATAPRKRDCTLTHEAVLHSGIWCDCDCSVWACGTTHFIALLPPTRAPLATASISSCSVRIVRGCSRRFCVCCSVRVPQCVCGAMWCLNTNHVREHTWQELTIRARTTSTKRSSRSTLTASNTGSLLAPSLRYTPMWSAACVEGSLPLFKCLTTPVTSQERVAKILGGANLLPVKPQYRQRAPKKAEEA